MKDQEYQAVWQTQIRPFLEENEDSRFQLKLWYCLVFFSMVGLLPALTLVDPDLPAAPVWAIIVGLVFSGSIAFWVTRINTDFASKFKQGIFSVVSKVADFDWSVNPEAGADISGLELIEESRLYHGYNEIISDDTLTASFQSNEIIVREVDALVEIDNDSNYSIFNGFIAKVSINNAFGGETFVQTEADGSIIDSGAGGLFDDKQNVEETELEWGEFERFLAVKSSDPQEAREIFTPDFMAVLYDWWQDRDKQLRIAFRNKAMYIGFPTDVDLEPRLFGGIDNERGAVRDILEFILMLEDLTQILLDKQDQ